MKLRISFEFFPPKTEQGFNHLLEHALLLAKKSPKFFSVTFGAGGSTREGTLQAVKMLTNKTNIPVAPHLAAFGMAKKDIIDILNTYKDIGIKRLVVIRGDLPQGAEQETGDFKFANELISYIREMTDNYFNIEAAAYPEYHPQAKNSHEDVLNLKRKYEAGANSAITQYFFNPDAYFYFLDACNKEHIKLPIVPGIMPIIQLDKLIRFSKLCGAEIPLWLLRNLEAYQNDTASLQSFGLEVVSRLCERLISGGAPGLHFYTLNHSELSIKLLSLLRIETASPLFL